MEANSGKTVPGIYFQLYRGNRDSYRRTTHVSRLQLPAVEIVAPNLPKQHQHHHHGPRRWIVFFSLFENKCAGREKWRGWIFFLNISREVKVPAGHSKQHVHTINRWHTAVPTYTVHPQPPTINMPVGHRPKKRYAFSAKGKFGPLARDDVMNVERAEHVACQADPESLTQPKTAS